MSKLIEFEDLRAVCRICLNKNNELILLSNYFHGNDRNRTERLLISNVMEYVMSAEIDNNHPKAICPKCLDQMKSAYNLKLQFKRSQEILQKIEDSITASFIIDDHFDVINPDTISNDNDTQAYCESIPETENVFEIIVENSGTEDSDHLSHETSDTQEMIDSSNDEYSINKESELIESLEETCTKKQTNLIKLQTNNKYRDDIQVRYLDSNRFVIERKPVNNDKGLDSSHNPSASDVAAISDKCLQEKSMLGKTELVQECASLSELRSGRVYSKGKLQSHVTPRKNIKPSILTCKKCHKVFKTVKYLNFHMKLKHSVDSFPCKICGVVCVNYSARQIHMCKYHGNGKSFICEICNKGFFFNAALLKHKSKHTRETQEVCNICGKTFHYKGALFYHIKMHTNERKYLCNFCERRFYSSQALQRHLDTHTGERRYKCQYCEKSFRSSSERRRHEMTHTGERPYQCDYCDKGFISKYNLDVHTAGHRGQQPCVICSRKYLNAQVLQLHLKLKHKHKLEDNKNLE